MRRSVQCIGHVLETSNPCCFSGLYLALKESEIDSLTSDPYGSHPLSSSLVPLDSAIWRRSSARTNVLEVSSTGDYPKVIAPAIQAVAVQMISDSGISRSQPKQRSMQTDGVASFSLAATASSVPGVIQVPPPLTSPTSICRVNDGVYVRSTSLHSERDKGRDSIWLQDGPQVWWNRLLTLRRTESSCFGSADDHSEGLVAILTDQTDRRHILSGHRVTSGVSPRPLARRGDTLRCTNYTVSTLVKAA